MVKISDSWGVTSGTDKTHPVSQVLRHPAVFLWSVDTGLLLDRGAFSFSQLGPLRTKQVSFFTLFSNCAGCFGLLRRLFSHEYTYISHQRKHKEVSVWILFTFICCWNLIDSGFISGFLVRKRSWVVESTLAETSTLVFYDSCKWNSRPQCGKVKVNSNMNHLKSLINRSPREIKGRSLMC